MAYLAPHFDYDVFMSYAHGRRPGLTEAPLRDWSQKFIDLLRADIYALRPDLGAVDFWDDRNVDRTAALTDEIKSHAEKSGVLLIIMSTSYLQSKWCKDELEWFKGQFLGRRGSPGRVFVIRAVSTSTDGWPEFLKDARGHSDIGFQFHRETTDVGIEPHGWPDLSERTREFNAMFATLRTTLIKRLEAIKASLPPTSLTSSAPHPPPRSPLLYLHAPSGPDDVRVEVENDLRDDGYRIVPAVPRAAGSELASWQAEVTARVQVAQKCDVLTLLRSTDDPSFNDEFLEVGADELSRINTARRGRPLPCAILDRSNAPFELADFAKQTGVALFDLSNPGWRPQFKTWLSETRA
jgi:TIR domain